MVVVSVVVVSEHLLPVLDGHTTQQILVVRKKDRFSESDVFLVAIQFYVFFFVLSVAGRNGVPNFSWLAAGATKINDGCRKGKTV